MPIDLRPATSADLAAVVHLMNLAYRGHGSEAGWATETVYIQGDRTTQALLGAEIAAKPDAVLLVGAIDPSPSIAACVWLEPLSSDTWYLGSLTVNPQLQNTGIGRDLLAAAERWALTRGAKTIEITVVNVRTKLIDWYLRRGYHLTGTTRPFPYDDTRFGTPLRNDLAFAVLDKRFAASAP